MITTEPQGSLSRFSSYLANLSPIPAFPEYTGPYKVGSVDVEIPVDELPSVSSKPGGADGIDTVQFRIFYPATEQSDEKCINWLPNPQRHYVSSYTKFVGVGSTLSDLLSFIPRHLHYTTIPAHKNARLVSSPADSQRWPLMIFSHGLGGSRNSYSYIAGSLASHGVIVVCPEHRDGSAVTSFIRVPHATERTSPDGAFTTSLKRRVIPYNRISHDVCPATYEARDNQLRVRAWELGLVHQALLAIDKGVETTNLNTSTPTLQMLQGKMNMHEPGSIIFAGHSFGATTMYQFLKSTYYADRQSVAGMLKPIFRPKLNNDLRNQITEQSVMVLLDMWCMPLMSPDTSALFDFPLPQYDDKPTAAGGQAILAIESQAFYKWTEHLNIKARALCPRPSDKQVTAQTFVQPGGTSLKEPNFFYVVHSAHLSQSDFGILFPWLTRKIFNATEPERALRLNLRALLQHLRNNRTPVARTHASDLIDGCSEDKIEGGVEQDTAILDRHATVDCWESISLVGLGNENDGVATIESKLEEGEKDMEGEMEMDVSNEMGQKAK